MAEAVRREVTSKDGVRHWVQRYVMATGELRVADFSVGAQDPYSYLNLVFDNAERTGPRGSAFSRLLGMIVAEKFDGMLVPGVQGCASCDGSGFAYANLVMFNWYGRWERWLDKSWSPRVLE